MASTVHPLFSFRAARRSNPPDKTPDGESRDNRSQEHFGRSSTETPEASVSGVSSGFHADFDILVTNFSGSLEFKLGNSKVGRPRSEPTVVVRIPAALRHSVDSMVEHWRDQSAVDQALKVPSRKGTPLTRLSVPRNGVKVLKPADAFFTLRSLRQQKIVADALILDPWYEPAPGKTVSEHRDFYRRLIRDGAKVSKHIFCWGTANMLGPLVEAAPEDFILRDWLVWSHQNTPSVDRQGWRSTHQTCLHFSAIDATVFPERFFTEKQKNLLKKGRLRYWPSPSNVIEAGLLAGFVGKEEKVGHPAQKPLKVIAPLLKMTCPIGGLVIDPFAGSGTTGVAAMNLNLQAILCDISPKYTSLMRKRIRSQKVLISATPTALS